MAALKIPMFGGMRPAQDDRLLPESAAAHSENCWLYSGQLRGTNTPTFIRNCTAGTSKVFRIPNNYLDAAHLADADWLEFADPDTDVIRAPVADDTYERYYWASPSASPRYNTRARITAGSAAWVLGIPAPSAAPSVTPSGGSSSTTTSRSYVYTWVSAYGEEGPPSPPLVVMGKIDDTWNVTVGAAASTDLGGVGHNRNLTLLRIYRTVTSSAGVATYFLVREQAIGTLTYADSNSDTTVASNSELESTNWSAPPTTLKGWVVMPNGIVAGWTKNEVWFCEPYRPHAWPALYTLTVNYPVVGLGVVGQTLVVCTQGYPAALTGVHPATITESQLAAFEPCTSRGSIISAAEGVYYASPNGLILVANGGATNVTRTLINKDKWLELAPTSSLRAALLGGAYYAFGSTRAGVFQTTAFETTAFTQADFAGSYDGILIDPTNERVAFNILSNVIPAVNSFNDPWSGELFIIRADKLYWVNIADTAPTYETFIWRSKIFQTQEVKDLAALRVYFEIPSTAPTLNPVRNTNLVQTLQSDQYGLVRMYADDTLICTRELRESGELMRVPSGFMANYWQFEFEARVKISQIQIGTSAKELRKV